MQEKQISVVKKAATAYRGELLVIPVMQDNFGGYMPGLAAELLAGLAGYGEFSGKSEQCLLLYPPFATGLAASLRCRRLLFVGLGGAGDDDRDLLHERLRLAGGAVAAQCKAARVEELALCAGCDALSGPQTALLLEGLLLGDYRFLKYKTPDPDEPSYDGIKTIAILAARGVAALKHETDRVARAAAAVHVARDMANEPGNGWTASHFARYAEDLAGRLDISCSILEKEDMAALGMGGILAVNQGSLQPPKMVILHYRPDQATETILLVGKGLTFDSGGISLKPAQGMMDMKYDMCGGAAVLAAMEVIATERPRVGVVAIVPSTDNMVSGGALKPGDVITHYGGVTAEIESTDAEGRLLLADALAYGIEKYAPTCAIDVATLTGSMIFALGHHYCGFMSNDQRLSEKLASLGRACGEPLWRMPLDEAYKKQLKSEVADMKNTGGKAAGCVTAAEYLHRFVGTTPWAHLDIAGTAWNFTEKSYVPKGPSGFGVRVLIELVRNWQAGR